MSIFWTTNDDRHARMRDFPLYLTDEVIDGVPSLRYSMSQESIHNAKLAAERGDPVAEKALLLLTIQRMERSV